MLADEDGAHNDREPSVEHRNATALPSGAGIDVRVSGGDAVTEAELIAISNAFSQAEFDRDRDHAARLTEFGTNAASEQLARTSAQRHHDEFVEIFRRAANTHEPAESPATDPAAPR